jgi:hypothetical protein
MEKIQFKISMPLDVKKWVALESAKNLRSQNATINHILKEKMEKQEQTANA